MFSTVFIFFRTYISRDERTAAGFEAAKDRLTLALGGNAEGDCKWKPLLVYHSRNPQGLKDINKNTLPVMWTANTKAWVTKQIFHNYIVNYLSPFIQRDTHSQHLPNKALLVLDNTPGHPPDMKD